MKYCVHYTVDTVQVSSLSGVVEVSAQSEELARTNAIINLAWRLMDITRIQLHEIHEKEEN